MHPSFETAGIHLTYQGDPKSTSVTIKYRKVGAASWFEAHPPVRYDGRHSATSLFDLAPGTKYEVQVSGKTYSLTTRKQFSLPTPTKVVNITAGDSAGLQAALKAASAGTEIRIPKGTYSGGFSVDKSGTEAHPIVVTGILSAADKAKAIENRSDLPKLTNGGGVGFAFQNAAHVVLQNVRVANADSYGVLVESSHHCVVQHCQVYDNDDGYSDTSWRFNIRLNGGGSSAGYNLIQYNHVADTDNVSFDAGEPWNGSSNVTYFGINNLGDSGPGVVIRGNRVEGHYDCIVPCPDESDNLDPGENSTDALGSHNQAGFNVEVYDNYIYFCRDDGIESDGFCVNARIFRNTIVKVNNGVSIAPALPGPFFWVRNRVQDIVEGAIKINTSVGSGSATIRNHYFYHNTFSKGANGGTLMAFGGGTTSSKLLHYRNNIFHSSTDLVDDWGSHIPQPSMDGDLWYSTSSSQLSYGGSSFSDFSDFKSGTGQEANGLWADPQIDPATLDLKAGSPAIDKALSIPGINNVYSGAGPDIGAHEHGTSKPPPPPPPPTQSDAGGTTPMDSGPSPSPSSPDAGPLGPDAMMAIMPASGPDNTLTGGCAVASGMTTGSWLVLALLGLALWWTGRSLLLHTFAPSSCTSAIRGGPRSRLAGTSSQPPA